ncbi:MAG TPA: hypothetical protein PKD59_00360 [Miltoncostaeaceae bacterium]|nr:hypothetical protein [Miltoncostaeaceae bacterium]
MPDTIAGIPAHPLIVHIPVVFIPLTLVIAIAAVAWRSRRRELSLVALGAALVGMLGAQLATMSGESLQEQIPGSPVIRDHAELGEGARTLAIIVFLAAAAFAAREFRDRFPRRAAGVARAAGRPAAAVALSVVLLATSAAATAWTVRAGHMGAKAAWHDVASRDATAAR